MNLVTAKVFAPGKPAGRCWPDQIVVDSALGLLAVASTPHRDGELRPALRMALETVRAHVARNVDILDRFRAHPSDALRSRVLAIVEEAFGRANAELFAIAQRRPNVLITLDVVLMLRHETFVGHVGDGRVYLARHGLVHQLTVDHSTGAEPDVFDLLGDQPDTDVRALGPRPRVAVETLCLDLSLDDRIVVLSGARHRQLPQAKLHAALTGAPLGGLANLLTNLLGDECAVGAAGQLGSDRPSGPQAGGSRLALLAPMPLFLHCTEAELHAAAAATRPRIYSPGAMIFRAGELGTELFLLIRGQVRIEKEGKAIILLGPGSNFGEMAMLDAPKRSATAIATEECEVLVIPRAAFFALLRNNPELAVKLLWNMLLRLSSRLRVTNDRLATALLAAELADDDLPSQPPRTDER